MGFCRTNLFKRLESSGQSFLLSIERHVLRNHVFLHAIENSLPLPIGTTNAGLLDPLSYDADADEEGAIVDVFEDEGSNAGIENPSRAALTLRSESDFRNRAAAVYQVFLTTGKRRFRWLPSSLFVPSLANDLAADARMLMEVLARSGVWDAARDAKLNALHELLTHDTTVRRC